MEEAVQATATNTEEDLPAASAEVALPAACTEETAVVYTEEAITDSNTDYHSNSKAAMSTEGQSDTEEAVAAESTDVVSVPIMAEASATDSTMKLLSNMGSCRFLAVY
jgi:hypothetical protein